METERIHAGEASAKSLTGASREKRWNELGIEEKVERLRMALRVTNAAANQAHATANEAHGIASRHEHGAECKVVMPVKPDYGNHPLAYLGQGRERDSDYVDRLLA